MISSFVLDKVTVEMLNIHHMGIGRIRSASVFIVAVVTAGALFAPQAARAADPTAGELFRALENKFQLVSTLSYNVKRIIVSRKSKSEEQWLFRYKQPNLLRVDYYLPRDRIIIVGGSALWEYIPRAKKAARTDLAALTRDKRERTISQVMSHVMVDGLRVGNFAELEKKAQKVTTVTWAGTRAYEVIGANPRYAIYIDREKNVLLRSEIYDQKGTLIMRTEASRFTEIAAGFWMPREIKASYASADGYVQTTVYLSEQHINDPIADSVYQFTVPQGVEVVNY